MLIFGSVEFNDILYLFGTRNGTTFVSSDLGTTWTALNPGGGIRECVSMAVFVNTVWMPATPGSANGGIKWTPGGGAVAVAAMPRGVNCTVHKNRLYIVPGAEATLESRLIFSDPANFDTWTGTNFIDVAQGDGTALINLIVYQDNLLLFKEESTFVLAYDLDPADAVLREINPVVGTNGYFGVIQHENTVYILHNGKVYEIVNFNFGLLNLKVPFEFENSLPLNTTARYVPESLSLLGDRLIVRFFNRTYAFDLRVRTWSEWRKTDTTETIEWHVFGPLIRAVLDTGLNVYSYYTTYSFDMNNATGYKIIKVVEDHTVADMEGFGDNIMHCILSTKDYDMADPIRYKRLFWWGADVLTGNDIKADVLPITLVFSPTWAQLGDFTWNDLNTWGQPLTESSPTETIVLGDNLFTTNKLVKFLKSLRFRKVNFSLQLISNGSLLQPTKVFSLIAIVKTKQLVSARSS